MGLFERLDADRPRAAFIGIDGVPFELIEQEPDVFEHLNRLIDAGVGTSIESIYPPESSACWPALTTGRNPGETGVYGFQERRPDTYETYVPRGDHVDADRIWDRVHAAGGEATVLNVPVTFPPQPDVQRMIAGFLAPGLEAAASSDEVASTAEEHGYRIDVDARLGHDTDKSAFFEDAHATLEARLATFEEFLAADDWDLFFGVFMTPDRVNHFAFGEYVRDGTYADAFLAFYRELDAAIGRIHEALPEDVPLIVASDHGFTRLEYEVDLNAWLQEADWLSFSSDDPSGLVDIENTTQAYAFVPGRIHLNLEGREPDGCVTPADYETVCAEIAGELLELTDPIGRRVIDQVVTRAEAFDGPHIDRAPDLVAIPREGYDLKAGFDGSTEVFSRGPRNGMHTFEGATLIADRDIQVPAEPSILDIAPILADALDLHTEPEDSAA